MHWISLHAKLNLNDIGKPIIRITCNTCKSVMNYHLKSCYVQLRDHFKTIVHQQAIDSKEESDEFSITDSEVTCLDDEKPNRVNNNHVLSTRDELKRKLLDFETQLNILRVDVKLKTKEKDSLAKENEELKKTINKNALFYKELIDFAKTQYENDKNRASEEIVELENRVDYLTNEINKLKNGYSQATDAHEAKFVKNFIEFVDEIKISLNLNEIDVGRILDDRLTSDNAKCYLDFLKICIDSKLNKIKEDAEKELHNEIRCLKEKLFKIQNDSVNKKFQSKQLPILKFKTDIKPQIVSIKNELPKMSSKPVKRINDDIDELNE